MKNTDLIELKVEKAPNVVAKDKQEHISDIMFELGVKYSKMCFDKDAIKDSKVAFRLAKEAFSMVLQAEPVKITDITAEFIKLIENKTPRSETWVMYLQWCSARDLMPVSKRKFLFMMEQSGFKFSKIGGQFLAVRDGAKRK